MAIFRALLASLLITGCATTRPAAQKQLALSDVNTGSKATVLYFWATQCPCVSRYQERIHTLASRYEAQGIAFVGISSNSDDGEEAMKRVSAQRGWKLPLIKDEAGLLATTLNARTTPTVVMLDHNGETRFKGWIDNERHEGDAGRIAYLEDAIKNVLLGEPVKVISSPIYGCRITKRLR